MFVNQSQEKTPINLRRLSHTAYAPHAAEKNVDLYYRDSNSL